MKTLTFLAITLLSGAIAGTVLGLINLAIVEPFIDKAIGIESQRDINAGLPVDNPVQQSLYRMWQKEGAVVAATIYGISLSALFGIIYAYSRNSLLLPRSTNKKKALLLAGIMFSVLFLVPALKYPPNPPAVGNPPTIYYRESLYIAFLVVSGFSSLALALLYRKLGSNNKSKKKIIIPLMYGVIIVGAYFAFPPNPDKITIPIDLVISFRVVSIFTVGIFWGLMAVILGTFWDKLKPHETSKIVSI